MKENLLDIIIALIILIFIGIGILFIYEIKEITHKQPKQVLMFKFDRI